ncbi:MAG: dihydropyrimidinase [Elusimicrobia bacterium RBG_16_66_12]|nr:MAG: dihydropyrimidinase [Elusimicrobia bacterium RBG_16_66_12]
MSYDLVVKGGTVVSASDTFVADIGVADGRVAAVGRIEEPGRKTVDARGKVVLPGGIDAHTHFDMPFMGATTIDDFTTGTTGAVFGGTTSIIDFAIQSKGRTFRHALDDWHKRAAGRCAADYGFHMIATDFTADRELEMSKMIDEGVSSFKLFMAYPGSLMSDDGAIFRALQRTKDNGGMVCMHAENGSVISVLVKQALAAGHVSPEWHALTRPMTAEAEATRRAIALAELAAAPLYIVHLSAGGALEEVRRARARGLPVFAETCPQYLYLSHDDYRRPGFEGAKFVMSPPLRPKGNEEKLWEGLGRNDLQVVSTDHCSFNMKDGGKSPGKVLGKKDFSKIPNGAPGVEYRMLLLWDAVQKGRITENRFVALTATNPAKIFGLYPRKGHLNPGADADIVVLDPNKTHTFSAKNHHVAADYNPYEGKTVKGSIRDVFVRGTAMVEGGKWTGRTTHGKFLRRTPRSFDLAL